MTGSELRLQTVREGELEQQLKDSRAEVMKNKDETRKTEEKLLADLKKAADTETELRRQLSALRQQLQQVADREKTLQEELKSMKEQDFSHPGTFSCEKFHQISNQNTQN